MVTSAGQILTGESSDLKFWTCSDGFIVHLDYHSGLMSLSRKRVQGLLQQLQRKAHAVHCRLFNMAKHISSPTLYMYEKLVTECISTSL